MALCGINRYYTVLRTLLSKFKLNIVQNKRNQSFHYNNAFIRFADQSLSSYKGMTLPENSNCILIANETETNIYNWQISEKLNFQYGNARFITIRYY